MHQRPAIKPPAGTATGSLLWWRVLEKQRIPAPTKEADFHNLVRAFARQLIRRLAFRKQLNIASADPNARDVALDCVFSLRRGVNSWS